MTEFGEMKISAEQLAELIDIRAKKAPADVIRKYFFRGCNIAFGLNRTNFGLDLFPRATFDKKGVPASWTHPVVSPEAYASGVCGVVRMDGNLLEVSQLDPSCTRLEKDAIILALKRFFFGDKK
jgi:hypothetical protein